MNAPAPPRRSVGLPWRVLVVPTIVVTVASALLVVGGGTLVWMLERQSDRANLRQWADSVWWAMTTITTVGYGEHFPVTAGGRLVAAGLMAAGVAVIGAVAAVVAMAFSRVREVEAEVEEVAGEIAAEGRREVADIDELTGAVARLTDRIAALEAALEAATHQAVPGREKPR